MRIRSAVALVLASLLGVPALAAAQPPAQAQTEQKEQKEKEKEKKEKERKEPNPKAKLVWLDAEAGVETANLGTFTEDFHAFSVGFLPRAGTGPMGGAAVGLRLVFVTLGVRARIASFTDDDPSHAVHGWTMTSIDGELGFRAPLGRLEPVMTLAFGYTTLGGFGDAVRGLSNGLDANGVNGRLGLGFDYFISRWVSLGVNGSGELVALTRPGIPLREIAALPTSQQLDVAAVRFLEANGSTYGLAFGLTGGVKVSF